MIFTACQALPDTEHLGYGVTDTIARKIVTESFDRIELVLEQYRENDLFDTDNDIINEDLLDEKRSSDKQEEFLKPYRGAFRALFAEERLEPLMRTLLYEYYHSMHDPDLSKNNIDLRFELVEEKEDEFTARFIQMADATHQEKPREFTVVYVKEHQVWLLYDYHIEEIDNPKLDLTIEDIKEYYHYQHNSQADMIDSTEEYYIFRIKKKDDQEAEPYVVAFHRDTTLQNPELAGQYKP